jgi:hypothetical protein
VARPRAIPAGAVAAAAIPARPAAVAAATARLVRSRLAATMTARGMNKCESWR